MKNLSIEEEYCIDSEILAQKYGQAARVVVIYPKEKNIATAQPRETSSSVTVVPFDELGGKVLRKYVSRKNPSRRTSLTTRASGSHLLAVVVRAHLGPV